MQCILTIRFRLAPSLSSDHRRISPPQLDMQSPSSCSNQRACPLASIPTRTSFSWAARSR